MTMTALVMTASAQTSAGDSVLNHLGSSRLSVGGYGEICYSRNYFSDHVSRYSQPEEHKNDPSHGKFDLPHAVVYLGYDFGKGWTFGTEIEFEPGGNGLAYEKEDEEGGEWEQEVEKGGEVELEQFWIQKRGRAGAVLDSEELRTCCQPAFWTYRGACGIEQRPPRAHQFLYRLSS